MALAAYRHLLRATRIAFHEDFNLLHAARSQARVGFDKQSSLEPSSEEATKAIAHAEGVAQVLRHNIVQGVQGAGDDAPLSKSQVGWSCLRTNEAAELRIHEDTERGENDTIKNPLVPGGKVKIGGA